jgi:magnesium chelatase family protein
VGVKTMTRPLDRRLAEGLRPARAVVREHVAAARARAESRQGSANVHLASDLLDLHCRLDSAASSFLQSAALRLGSSERRVHRVLRVARTIADFAACDSIGATHLCEAIQYRRVLQPA